MRVLTSAATVGGAYERPGYRASSASGIVGQQHGGGTTRRTIDLASGWTIAAREPSAEHLAEDVRTWTRGNVSATWYGAEMPAQAHHRVRTEDPSHGYIENTLARIDAAFDAVATTVEIDAPLTADGGATCSFRGCGSGAMPNLREVLSLVAAGSFLIDQMDGSIEAPKTLFRILTDRLPFYGRQITYRGTDQAFAVVRGAAGIRIFLASAADARTWGEESFLAFGRAPHTFEIRSTDGSVRFDFSANSAGRTRRNEKSTRGPTSKDEGCFFVSPEIGVIEDDRSWRNTLPPRR